MKKYSLSIWWLALIVVLSIACINIYNLYDSSRDIDRYNSELRSLNTSVFDRVIFSAIKQISLAASSLLIENVDSQIEDVYTGFEKKNNLTPIKKPPSRTGEVVIDEALASKKGNGAFLEFLESQEATLEEYQEALDKLTRDLETKSNENDEKRQEIRKRIDESEKRFTTSLALVVACISISSLLIGTLNLILKYYRSFNYFFISDKSSEALILVNNHDKAETILSISFEKISEVYRWKTEIHSLKAEPISMSAFGHVRVPVPEGFIEQTKLNSKSCVLTITTRDLTKNRCKLIMS